VRRPDALAWRDWARRRRSTHLALKTAVALAGLGLVVAGAAMLVLPGPGWAAIFLGLVVLGSEFDAAARLRERLQEKVRAGWSSLRTWRRGRRTPTQPRALGSGATAEAEAGRPTEAAATRA